MVWLYAATGGGEPHGPIRGGSRIVPRGTRGISPARAQRSRRLFPPFPNLLLASPQNRRGILLFHVEHRFVLESDVSCGMRP
jgi:hypothetical protein